MATPAVELPFPQFMEAMELTPQMIEEQLQHLNRTEPPRQHGYSIGGVRGPDAPPTPAPPVTAPNAPIPIVDPCFPVCVEPDISQKLLSIRKMFNPDTLPEICMRGDVDSVYTIAGSLSEMVTACGSNNWQMLSRTSASSADTGSRFCVNSDLCETHPFVSAGEARTAPMNWYPNTKIATVQMGDWGFPMHIHLYFLGVEMFRSNAHLSTLCLGVINAMFNLARNLTLENAQAEENEGESMVTYSMQMMHDMRTRVGSMKWQNSCAVKKTHLSAAVMTTYAASLELALDLMASDDQRIDFERNSINGIWPENNREISLNRAEMVKFAGQLKNAMVFTASIAGCKEAFTQRKECFLRVAVDPDEFRSMVFDEESIDQDILEANAAMALAGMQEEGHVPFDKEHNLPYQLYPHIIEAWEREINKTITDCRNELQKTCMKIFAAALGPDAVTIKPRWYVDNGFMVSFAKGDHGTHIFPLIDQSTELLKSHLKQCRSTASEGILCGSNAFPHLNQHGLNEVPSREALHFRSVQEQQAYLDERRLLLAPDDMNLELDPGHGVIERPAEDPEDHTRAEDDSAPKDSFIADRSLRLSTWEQFATTKAIGGVHSGSIMLFLVPLVTVSGTRLALADGNRKCVLSGGQIYVPVSKKLVRKDDPASRNADVPALPAMLYTFFSQYDVLPLKQKDVMSGKVTASIRRLCDVFTFAQDEIILCQSTNTLRYEVFAMTDMEGELDLLGVQDYVNSWAVSSHSNFLPQYGRIMEEVIVPLHKVFVETNSMQDLHELSVPVKGMLLLCAELAVYLADYQPFNGRIMMKIKESLPEEDRSIARLWHIPKTFLHEITNIEAELTGLKFGLCHDLLALSMDERALRVQRPLPSDTFADITRSPHIQMYTAVLDIGVNHPATFLKSHIKICCLIHDAIDKHDCLKHYLSQTGTLQDDGQIDVSANPTPFNRQRRSTFRAPDFKKLSECSPGILKDLMEQVALVIAIAYDYEWFCIYRTCMRKHVMKYNKGAVAGSKVKMGFVKRASFPTSVAELAQFVAEVESASSNLKIEMSDSLPNASDATKKCTSADKFESFICSSFTATKPTCYQWSRSLTHKLVQLVRLFLRLTQHEIPAAAPAAMVLADSQEDGISNAPLTTRGILSDGFLRSKLVQAFSSANRKRDSSDESKSIIWHTQPGKMLSLIRGQDTSRNVFIMHAMVLDVGETIIPAHIDEEVQRKLKLSYTKSAKLSVPSYFLKTPVTSHNAYANDLFAVGNHLCVLSIIRLRVMIYCGSFIGSFPSSHVGFDVAACQLTNTTWLHQFCCNERSHKNSFKSIFGKSELNMKGQDYNHWMPKMMERIHSEEKPSTEKGARAQQNATDLARSAYKNYLKWAVTDGDESNGRRVAQCNYRSLFQYEDGVEEEADKCLLEHGLATTRTTYASQGIITPWFLDMLHQWYDETQLLLVRKRDGELVPTPKEWDYNVTSATDSKPSASFPRESLSSKKRKLLNR